ncbi:MAG: hypothetical protein PUE08_02355 [Eubacteriales bacterium]|nr:hypothetical protein [Eubacteriales bacterium]
MIIDITKYCTASNASIGVIQAVREIQSGDTLYFPENVYHFYKDYSIHKVYHMTNTDSFVKPDKYFGILIEDKENITIDGGGSVFVIHGDMCALSLIRCKNIKLKNFTVRYNSPTNFEMTVKEKSLFKIKYEIPDNSTFYVKDNKITFFEQSPFTKKNYYEYTGNKECYCNVIHRGDEVFRTQLSPVKTALKIKRTAQNEVVCTYPVAPALKVGDTIAMSRNWCRDNCGLFFWECCDIASENITVNYMHGFGWLSQMCENLSFDKISFVPAKGYHVSSFADCIHVCGCKGYVNITDCLFTHPHDDGINIHGAFLRLKNIIDIHTAEFEFVHKQQGGYKAFFPGNKVKLYRTKDLSELDGLYTVESTEDDIEGKTVKIKFKETLPPLQKTLFVCENVTYNPEVKISGCTFKAIPTRGILCTTDRKSEICDNNFKSLKMPDIFISCDCRDWYESGPCRNMKIHNNMFSQKNPVVLKPIAVVRPVANVHKNIEIYDNEIKEN